MKIKRHRTYSQPQAQVDRRWVLLDAKGQVLGRLATEIADLLQGKGKATYTPHIDGGDYVVVINASQVLLTRAKADHKVYTRHSNYPGGLSSETFAQAVVRNPDRVIKTAVKGMLPDNKLRRGRLARLKVFPGVEHDYKNYIKE